MINFTSKFIYATYALVFLAENPSETKCIKTIADKKKIPQKFLAQILNKLANAGIVKNTRGVNGGCKLNVPAEKISLLLVIETLEGKISFCDNIEKNTSLFSVFNNAEKVVKKSLTISLADLIEKQKHINSQILYYI